MPAVMAFMAWSAEYFGAVCLALGVAVRWFAIALMFTMVVAATTVHWDNGWQAVHEQQITICVRECWRGRWAAEQS
jgi:putative oxidoreductase